MRPRIFAIAAAHEEGYYVNGSIPQKCNNPCDLELGDIGYGTFEGKTIFATSDDGWAAADRQFGGMLSGMSHIYTQDMTLEEAGLKYSGGDPNWAKNVAAMLNVNVTVTLRMMAEMPDERETAT